MLILARHGQTAANAEGRLLGRLDPPLTDLGRRQAMALAASVGVPTRVVTSPLGRARETATLLGLPSHVPITVDERWVEIDYGIYDGRPLRDVPPDLWAEWRADSGFRPPGGESLADLGRRVRAACEELAEEAADADVVVVSHVSPIKAAVAWALGAGDEVAWRTRLDVAAVSRIAISRTGPSMWAFNDVSHLARVEPAGPGSGNGQAPASRAAVPLAEVGRAEAPGAEVSGAEVSGAEVPGAEVPGAEVPGAEVPGAEVPGAEVLAAAAERRARWQAAVAAVAAGEMGLDQARADPALAGIKAVKIIEVLPGAGKVKGRRAMAEARIGERQRLGELSAEQMTALRIALGR